jgi:hypothetical protein
MDGHNSQHAKKEETLMWFHFLLCLLPFSQEENGFVMKNGICVEGVTPETLRSFCENFLVSGTCCLRLRKLMECNLMTGNHVQEGLMFQVSPASFLYHNLNAQMEGMLKT